MTDLSTSGDIGVTEAMIAEAKAANEQLETLLASVPSIDTVTPEQTRNARASGQGVFGAVPVLEHGRTISIPTRAGEIPARVFSPDDPDAVFLHIHGGGWVLGSAFQQDPALDAFARQANVAIVSIEYRLAPENPYPAGPDDCEDAALWAVKNAGAEFGTDRLIIGGESAGAHLSVVTLLRLRDKHAAHEAFKAANLVFGAYDLGLTPSQRNWGDRNLILSAPIMRWFYDHFLPGRTEEERRAPDISPLYADLTGLPPALFTVGTMDPLLDDSLFMYARWRAAGNEARLDVYPEGIHGFTAFPIGLGQLATARQLEWVGRQAKA